jgi:hypothetical protein
MTQKYNHKWLVGKHLEGNGHGLQETIIFPNSKKDYLPHFKISEIRVHLTFDGVYELMLKNYILWQKCRENLHVYNASHGTVNTKIARKEIFNVFLNICCYNCITCNNVQST